MTSNKLETLTAENKRLRELNRTIKAENQLLRQDMESGKIHLRVNPDPDFRKKLAEAIVKESCPGWSGGGHYCDPIDGKVYYKQSQAPWNPWSDDLDWRIVDVFQLVDSKNCDFDPSVDWSERLYAIEGYRQLISAYAIAERGEDDSIDADGDLADWVAKMESEIASWAIDTQWQNSIEEEESIAQDEAVNFAEREILDEIIIEIGEIDN